MNLYQTLYDLIVLYVFDGVLPNSFQGIAVEIFVMAAWLLCLSIPFVVVIFFIVFLSSVVRGWFS